MNNHSLFPFFEAMKSPICRTGNKFRQITDLKRAFPEKINNFVDVFCGGLDMTINIQANNYFANDVDYRLIQMYKLFMDNDTDLIINSIKQIIQEYNLKHTSKETFNELRKSYNAQEDSFERTLKLFELSRTSIVNEQRFNQNGEYNASFGGCKTNFKALLKELANFIERLKKIRPQLSTLSFQDFDYSFLDKRDFVYLDPPYFATNVGYTTRHIKWTQQHDEALFKLLDNLNSNGIRFGLSNFLLSRGQANVLLYDFLLHSRNVIYYDTNHSYKGGFLNYSNGKKQDFTQTQEIYATNYTSNTNRFRKFTRCETTA